MGWYKPAKGSRQVVHLDKVPGTITGSMPDQNQAVGGAGGRGTDGGFGEGGGAEHELGAFSRSPKPKEGVWRPYRDSNPGYHRERVVS